MNKIIPTGVGIAIAVLGITIINSPSEPIPPVTQVDLRIMIDTWMDERRDDTSQERQEDDTLQRLEIMKAFYTFQESGQKLTDDQKRRVMYNQIVKMVSFDIPKTELNEIKQEIQDELRVLGFDIQE